MIEPGAVRALLRRAGEAARVLGDPAIVRLAGVAEEHAAAPRLHVLIAGLTGSGRASVTNALLASPGLIPTSAIPKASADVMVHYGPSPAAEVLNAFGPQAIPISRLRSSLIDKESHGLTAVQLHAPAELLKTCDLRLAAIDGGRSQDAWRDLLAGMDYVILVLRAPGLLALTERAFIGDQLVPFGLHRVAIVINQIDLIDEEERPDLGTRVRDFLGPYERQPLILELHATAAPAAESGYPALTILAADLAERHPELHEAALLQTAQRVVDLLEETAEREAELSALGTEEIERVHASIAIRRDWLAGRAERTRAQVQTTATLARERLLRAIDGFSDMIRRRLPDEVVQVEDMGQIKQHLPGYLESVWTDFLQRQVLAVRHALLDEAQALGEIVDQDLRELLGNRPELMPAGAVLDLDVDAFSTFVTPKRGKHRAESIVRALSIYGYFMIMFNPTSGVLALGIGQVVRKVFGGEIALSDKRAIANAALNAMHSMEAELKAQIEQEFGRIVADLQSEVGRAYDEGVERIDAFLAEVARRQDDTEGAAERLSRLRRVLLPELRRSLDAMAGEPAPTADVAG